MTKPAPESWSGQVFLGMAYYCIGNYERALAVLNQAETMRVAGQEVRVPEPVAYTAMTLFQMGHQAQAIETLQALRSLYQVRRLFDVFKTLVTAEKTFVAGHATMLALWDRINEGNLDEALVLLTQTRNAPIASDIKATGTVPSAAQQLAMKFAWRAERHEEREAYASALDDYESVILAAPRDEALYQTLSKFKQQHLNPK
jgi:tetratricopeptide (TPR) repeat protein